MEVEAEVLIWLLMTFCGKNNANLRNQILYITVIEDWGFFVCRSATTLISHSRFPKP